MREAWHQQLGYETGPARLMRGAEATAVVTVEIFIELQVVAEVRIVLQLVDSPEYRSLALRIAREQFDQS